MNVVNRVKKNDLCCGCGVCSGVCPFGNLEMKWDNTGEYKPVEKDKCNERCNICLETCPVIETHSIDNIAEKIYGTTQGISYDKELGYYLNNYVGYIEDEDRLRSASGGLATWTMCEMLTQRKVDGIVTVGKSLDKEKLFEFKICTNTEEVKACASSAYYPVEVSEIINTILKEDNGNTYAIMGLPCMIYAIRKAQLKYKKLHQKIKYTFSLVCGQMVNKYSTEVLTVQSGVPLEQLDQFNYRRKREGIPASEFYQVPISKGEEINPIIFTQLPAKMWSQKFFTLESCNYCEDIFGELADAVFMDAWLPEYVRDWKGTTIVIIRNKEIDDIYQKENIRGNINLIDKDKVKESQRGRIIKKREEIKSRLTMGNKRYKDPIQRRVKSAQKVKLLDKFEIDTVYQMQVKSKSTWNKLRKEERIEEFWREMRNLEYQYKLCRLGKKIKRRIIKE